MMVALLQMVAEAADMLVLVWCWWRWSGIDGAGVEARRDGALEAGKLKAAEPQRLPEYRSKLTHQPHPAHPPSPSRLFLLLNSLKTVFYLTSLRSAHHGSPSSLSTFFILSTKYPKVYFLSIAQLWPVSTVPLRAVKLIPEFCENTKILQGYLGSVPWHGVHAQFHMHVNTPHFFNAILIIQRGQIHGLISVCQSAIHLGSTPEQICYWSLQEACKWLPKAHSLTGWTWSARSALCTEIIISLGALVTLIILPLPYKPLMTCVG